MARGSGARMRCGVAWRHISNISKSAASKSMASSIVTIEKHQANNENRAYGRLREA